MLMLKTSAVVEPFLDEAWEGIKRVPRHYIQDSQAHRLQKLSFGKYKNKKEFNSAPKLNA